MFPSIVVPKTMMSGKDFTDDQMLLFLRDFKQRWEQIESYPALVIVARVGMISLEVPKSRQGKDTNVYLHFTLNPPDAFGQSSTACWSSDMWDKIQAKVGLKMFFNSIMVTEK